MFQIFRFGAVGLSAMSVHWLIVRALVPAGMNPLVANVVAFGVAFQVSYFGHRNWTFLSQAKHSVTFLRFLAVAIASFVLNELMYFGLLAFTSFNYQVALVIVLLTVAALTFVLGKLWAFPRL